MQIFIFKESKPRAMDQNKRYTFFTHHLQGVTLVRKTELNYANPFQLLISVILSAQCTDKRVNLCTPALFSTFPTTKALANGSFQEVFNHISSITYPNSKANFLIQSAKRMVSTFDGQVPKTIADLRTLPGVGRKTAHVIASILYDMAVMAVDTHVFRVAKRIGLANIQAKTPLMVEIALINNLPTCLVQIANQWMLLHGRYICLARKPKCLSCPISYFCHYHEHNQHHEISTDFT